MSLTTWFSALFYIFICSFPDNHLFLINWNLLQFLNYLLLLLSELFPPICLNYYSFLPISCCLPVTCTSFNSKLKLLILILVSTLPIYQPFLIVSFCSLVVFTNLPAISTHLPVIQQFFQNVHLSFLLISTCLTVIFCFNIYLHQF